MSEGSSMAGDMETKEGLASSRNQKKFYVSRA